MIRKKILSYTLLFSLAALSLSAQETTTNQKLERPGSLRTKEAKVVTKDTLQAETPQAKATQARVEEEVEIKEVAETTELPSKKEKKAPKEHNNAFFKGISISADLFGVIGQVFGNDYTSYEAACEINLKDRYYPIVEIGYGSTDTTDDDKDIHYKVSAPYFRVGANYNFLWKKQTVDYVFGGVRLGFSSFSYDIDAPALTDPVWGGTVPFEYNGVSSNATWAEFVVGLRAQICKNFHMGWSLRYKRRLSVKETPNTEAWYIPGYGINGSSLFGATYNLIYYLPW